jgi:hypothetical protein
MAIESRDLIEEYYKTVKDKYPDLSFEKFAIICKAPFIFFKKAIESPDFPLIHVKYFCKFVVWPGNAKKIIELMKIFLRSGRLTQEQFDDRTRDLKAYVDEYESQNSPSSQGEKTSS